MKIYFLISAHIFCVELQDTKQKENEKKNGKREKEISAYSQLKADFEIYFHFEYFATLLKIC